MKIIINWFSMIRKIDYFFFSFGYNTLYLLNICGIKIMIDYYWFYDNILVSI